MPPDAPADAATDLFLALTPDRVLAAVETAGLACNPVCYPLNSFENRVYEVEREDRTRLVAKFYRPGRWTREQLLEEHTFLADLDAAEVPVCPVLSFPDGATLRRIDNIWYSLFPRKGGRAPDEFDDALVARLGLLTARIHNVGAQRPAAHRVTLSGDTYARADLAWLEAQKVLPAHLARRYLTAANRVADIADARLRGVATHRVHGDLHPGNLLLRDGVFHVLDLDDMAVGPAVQDLWLLLPGRDADTHRQRQIFLEAYEQLRPFDRGSLRLVEPLRGLRMIHYAAWIARRWHDPVFPRTFVHFGTEAYWAGEAHDLEEILAVIAAEDSAAPAGAPDTLGSNRDYFWDL